MRGVLDIEVDKAGIVQAVWLGCLNLPFEQHKARPDVSINPVGELQIANVDWIDLRKDDPLACPAS